MALYFVNNAPSQELFAEIEPFSLVDEVEASSVLEAALLFSKGCKGRFQVSPASSKQTYLVVKDSIGIFSQLSN